MVSGVFRMDGIKPPSGLQLSGDGANFKRFVQQFHLYLQAVNLGDVAESRKIALFLNCAGEDALEVYNTFSKDKVTNLQALIDKFKEYAEPRKNLLWLTYNLFTMKQQDGEVFDQFYTKVLTQAKKCDLGELEDRLITMVIVIGIRDTNVKERLLRESELKLNAAIDIWVIFRKNDPVTIRKYNFGIK